MQEATDGSGIKNGNMQAPEPKFESRLCDFTVFWNLLLSGSEENVFVVVLYKYRCKAHSQVHIIPGT